MKIAMLTPFEECIPPKKYGGTELVVYNLSEELVKAGHDVTLLATGDSKTSARLIEVFEKSIRSLPEAADMRIREALKYIGLGKVIQYVCHHDFDIIHNHIGWRVLPFEKIIDKPVVTTLHGPLDVAYQQKVYGTYPDSRYISISLNQRKPMSGLNFVANVYNGLQIEKFRFYEKPQDYFAFLGRMSPEKGPVEAIKIAKKAGVKLLMAAKVDAVDGEYYKKEVEPLIDGEQIKFIGEVDHEGKLELLGNAKALLAPIQWEEPFGLFFTEAMACGTPVITMRRGSVPELILDGQTGFICDNVKEAAEKIPEIEKINRQDCFEHVNKNFSSKKMAEDYVAAYQKVVKQFL